MAKTSFKMCIFVIFIATLPSAFAQLYGNQELITDTMLIDDVRNFEELTGTRLALAVLDRTDDIIAESEFYYNLSNADIIIVYDFGNNRIAVAKPVEKDALSDEKINSILDSRQNEKILIVDKKDAAAYLLNIINDIKEELAAEETDYGLCSIIKDGVCNESCHGDLDCDCGNNICDYHENYRTCPADCQKSEDYSCAFVSDNYCDENCALTDIDCRFGGYSKSTFALAKRKRVISTVLQAVIGFAIIMLTALLIFMIEKRRPRK